MPEKTAREFLGAEMVYHFTCTARLPWIIATKELRPSCFELGHFPKHDFVWATTCPRGDRTASAFRDYRKHANATALVRLTLFADDFEVWPAIIARFPRWTTEHVRDLEAAALSRGETNVKSWRARATPLPISRVICAEAKAYTGRWQTIELAAVQHPDQPTLRGIILNDEVYCSLQHVRAGKPTAYTTARMSLADWRSSTTMLGNLGAVR